MIQNGSWSFDRNLLVLKRVYGEEQPSSLDMHYGSFWIQIYDLPLILMLDTMAEKIENILGTFEEMDLKDHHHNVRLHCLKANVGLKQPLKRGTIVRFKDKSYIFFSSTKDYRPFVSSMVDMAISLRIMR